MGYSRRAAVTAGPHRLNLLKVIDHANGSVYATTVYRSGLHFSAHPNGMMHIRDDYGLDEKISIALSNEDLAEIAGRLVFNPSLPKGAYYLPMEPFGEISKDQDVLLDFADLLNRVAKAGFHYVSDEEALSDSLENGTIYFDPTTAQGFVALDDEGQCLRLVPDAMRTGGILEGTPLHDNFIAPFERALAHSQALVDEGTVSAPKAFPQIEEFRAYMDRLAPRFADEFMANSNFNDAPEGE